ncbi:hypothetical protein C8Q78DRAFT_673048 [Trametes maxima]|nr:hypothetical protein C8Q78DRAFT_673048 [Trametes maxima]
MIGPTARCVAEYRTKLPPIKDADLPDEFRWRARNSDVPHLLFGVHIAIDPQGVLDRAKELGVIPEEEKHCPSMRKCVTAIMTKVYKELAVLGPGLLVLGPMPKVDEGDTLGIVYLFSNDDRKKLDNAITIAAWILSSKRSSRYGDWKTSTIFRQNGTFTGQFMVSGITILNPSTR